MIDLDLGLGLGVLANFLSIQKRVFCNAILQTVDDMTSAPKTGTYITDR